jgi:hypothetical protein
MRLLLIIKVFKSVLVAFPCAIAIVWTIEFMMSVVNEIGLMFSGELAVRSKQFSLVHRPLLDRMLLFIVVVVSVCRAPVRVEGIAVGMEVIPSGQLCGWDIIALVEGPVSAVRLMGETQRMLVEFSNWHHLLEISMIWEVILYKERHTAFVVTP